MPSDLSIPAQQVLEAAAKAGATAADCMVVSGQNVSIDIRQGALEHADRSEGTQIGLRVLIGQRQASISSSQLHPDIFAEMAERAVAMAREAPKDPYIGLATRDQLAQSWNIGALDLADNSEKFSPAELQSLATRAEAAALAVKGVSQVQSASAGWSDSHIHLAASNGFSGGYRRTSTGISCVAITGSGSSMERDADSESRIYATDLPAPETIGQSAGTRAVARNGASKPPTGAFPVLFDERVSSSLIAHLVSAINGASIARGASWLQQALGQQILPDTLSLIEDPWRPRTPGSRPFDGEGLPAAKRTIIDCGTLTGWTLDLATGRKLGMPSTGNASRGTTGAPSPSLGNLWLTPGDQSREGLIADMGTGLVITSMIGSSINATTGDYSRGASGFWVENGQVTRPVNECTVAGNLRDMIKTIVPANDGRAYLSRVVPSLLVEGLTIAGG